MRFQKPHVRVPGCIREHGLRLVYHSYRYLSRRIRGIALTTPNARVVVAYYVHRNIHGTLRREARRDDARENNK